MTSPTCFWSTTGPIENRADDSVARVIADRPVVLRRGRGYVPRAIPVARPFARPVLACGAHLKNAFCLGLGGEAWLGPHVGDLDNLEACRSFEESIERLCSDSWASSRRSWPTTCTLTTSRRATPSGGPRPRRSASSTTTHTSPPRWRSTASRGRYWAWPSTGPATASTGPPGAARCCWRTSTTFERLATLRPIPLAGGDQAIREVWRIALAVLDDALAAPRPWRSCRCSRTTARARRGDGPADDRAAA